MPIQHGFLPKRSPSIFGRWVNGLVMILLIATTWRATDLSSRSYEHGYGMDIKAKKIQGVEADRFPHWVDHWLIPNAILFGLSGLALFAIHLPRFFRRMPFFHDMLFALEFIGVLVAFIFVFSHR